MPASERSATELAWDVTAVLEGLRVFCDAGADQGLEPSDGEPLVVLGATLAQLLVRTLEAAERAPLPVAAPEPPLPYVLQQLADSLAAMRADLPPREPALGRLGQAQTLVEVLRRRWSAPPSVED